MTVMKIDGVDGQTHYPVHDVTLYATAAITAGQVVRIDANAAAGLKASYGVLVLVEPNTTDDHPMCIGVSLDTVPAPASGSVLPVVVRVGGKIGDGDVGAPTAAAASPPLIDRMVGGSATAGRIKEAAAPTSTAWPFAICQDTYTVSDDDGNIFIIDKGWYNY